MSRPVLALIALIVALAAPAAAQADVVAVASGSNAGTRTATFQLTVPQGADRYLAVGVSTTDANTVTAVTFGAQTLTRLQQATDNGVRSETWVLLSPNVGTAAVSLTTSAAAPVVVGATTFAGVDQALPVIASSTDNQNGASNTASFSTNNTVAKDGMFSTITLTPVIGVSDIFTGASTDTITSDLRWGTAQGTIRGAGSSRVGNTGQNLALTAGIVFRWTKQDSQVLNPFALSWVALRASTGATQPVVTTPTAANITSTSATLGGTLASNGGATIMQRGVVYCQCATPVIGAGGVSQVNAGASDTTGPFAVSASPLTASTQYTYRAFATNAIGTTYTAATTFTTAAPPNQAPTANAGGPYSAGEGAVLTLNGSGTDADGDPLTYSWDINGDGTYGDATGATPTLTAAQREALGSNDGPASKSVRVRVSDGKVTTTSAATTLTIANVAPTATFASGVGPTVAENNPVAAVFSNPQDPSAGDTAAGFRYAYDWDNDGTWDVGDGTYAGSSTALSMTIPTQITRDGPATPTIHGAIIDRDGGVREYRMSFTVTNTAPTATASPRTVLEGQTATVGLSAASDVPADLATLRYAYDFDNDGTYDLGSTTYANANSSATANVPAALTADGPATRTVRLAVVDKDGGFSVYTETVTVTNVAPTGALAGQSVDEGQTAAFGLTTVADPGDRATVRYVYDFDGNGTDDTAAVTYANASTAATANAPAAATADGPSTRAVRVRVIDKDGASNVYTATLTVANVAPSFTPAATTPIDEGKVASVSVAGVTDPSPVDGAAGTRYAYDFDNDGTYDLGGTTYATASPLASVDLPAALTADGPGTHRVRIAVLDKDGGLRSDTVDVVVNDVAPTATLADVTAEEGTDATIAFTGADDVSAADKAAGFTFEWDADGDGTFEKGTGSITLPVPDGPLTTTIKGAIIDKDGGRREYSATLTATNAAPTAKISGPDAVPSSGETSLTVTTADVGADTVTAVLDWGDGVTEPLSGTGDQLVTHTYTTPGGKTITLVATDSDGAKSAIATHTLTVATTPAAPAPAATPTPTPAPSAPAAVTPASKQTITGVKVTPRCLRADDLRAKLAKVQTMKVRFSLGTAGPVKFTLQRLSNKGGASKCPPARGVEHPDGKRVPGVYRPFTNRSVTVKRGANVVTVAATARAGKRLTPGTYLLTVESGGVSARTKLWVLKN